MIVCWLACQRNASLPWGEMLTRLAADADWSDHVPSKHAPSQRRAWIARRCFCSRPCRAWFLPHNQTVQNCAAGCAIDPPSLSQLSMHRLTMPEMMPQQLSMFRFIWGPRLGRGRASLDQPNARPGRCDVLSWHVPLMLRLLPTQSLLCRCVPCAAVALQPTPRNGPASVHQLQQRAGPHLRGKVAGLDRLGAQDDVVAVVARQGAGHVAQLDHVDAAAGWKCKSGRPVSE